mmetsp:Transcript_21347/g.55477  ORF Transcript_21347/g.55477 Transcript_21347/m.55477 type:complete len:150 (-) Transcript_21347:118-567(-)
MGYCASPRATIPAPMSTPSPHVAPQKVRPASPGSKQGYFDMFLPGSGVAPQQAMASSRAEDIQRGQCSVCMKPRMCVECSFCENICCEQCTRTCEQCGHFVCHFCCNINYDMRYERLFCLSCEEQYRQDAATKEMDEMKATAEGEGMVW